MDFKKILQKLLYPPVWLMIILTLISAAGLAFVFLGGYEESPIAYVVYVLAFYTLSVVCLFFIFKFPPWYKSLKEKVYANKFGNRYMTDVVYKTKISLQISLAINILYIAINVASSIWYETAWFALLAGYYAILAVMRFILARYTSKNAIGEELVAEYKRSRACAVILLFVNFLLSGVVLMMMYQNRGYEYNGILIYIMAAYTFYITVNAIVKLIKYRKYNSPVMLTTKGISFASALVSMLALETAMFSQFGKGNEGENFELIMIGATGAGVSAVLILMSFYMIIHANREIKKLKNKEEK